MELTEEQFSRIAHVLPRQRGNIRISNLQMLNAILYAASNGCKWRARCQSVTAGGIRFTRA